MPINEPAQKEILNSIIRIEWDRQDHQKVTIYFEDNREPFGAVEFHKGSFTRGIIESIEEFIAGLLDLPDEQ